MIRREKEEKETNKMEAAKEGMEREKRKKINKRRDGEKGGKK